MDNRLYEVKSIGDAIRAGVNNIQPKQLNAVRWPHEASKVLAGAIPGHEDLLSIPGGFSPQRLQRDPCDRHQHSGQEDRRVHRGLGHRQRLLSPPRDVDNDGLLDIVTAGTTMGFLGEGAAAERVVYATL